MPTGRTNSSQSEFSENRDGSPKGFVSLKDPPSMHLREDMAKRRVRTLDGHKVMECALTWAEFERKYSGK